MLASNVLSVTTPDASIAKPTGYIYAVASSRFRALYIGQTAGRTGALGRLAQHLSYGAGNTFRKRLCEIHRYDDIDIGPVEFAAMRLRPREVFHERCSDYREAVEALVQYQLIAAISAEELRFGVISRVLLNGYTRWPYVAREADLISAHFLGWLRQLQKEASDIPLAKPDFARP